MRTIFIAVACLQVLQSRTVLVDALQQIAFPRHQRQISIGKRRLCRLRETGEIDPQSDSDESAECMAALSKVKWKKKRYLMIQDVVKLIEKRDDRAPRKAHENVVRMQKLSQVHQDESFLPDQQVYNLWINAISKCYREDNAGKQAEAVLEEMRRHDVEPNIISYTTVMDAYAQSSGRRNKAQEVERLLFDLIDLQGSKPHLKITSITADTVLKAWANRGDVEGATRAQNILERLEAMQHADLRPTVHSYGIVIHAWASCNGGLEAARNAEAILNRILEPNQRVKPDTVVFNSVINAFANSNDAQAGPKAVELLEKMRKLHDPERGFHTQPDSVTYGSVLNAWSHSDHPNAATQAERVLKEMQEAHKTSPCTSPAPNTNSLNNVLHAWSRSALPKAADRAMAVLLFMIQSDRKIIAPDIFSFTSVLAALAKSKDPEKAVKARQLLDTMIQMYDKTKRPELKPSQIPFNVVLNACAFSALETTAEQQKAALIIATATFNELRTISTPDTVSYGNLMKCFHNLKPPGPQRNKMALKLFENCTVEGLVGELVWDEVRHTVQSRALSKALSDDLSEPPSKVKVQDLPKAWTSRVRGDKLAAQRQSAAKARKRPVKATTTGETKRAPERRFRSISEPSYQSGKDL